MILVFEDLRSGGCTLAHSTDLHLVLCQIGMPQLCDMHKTAILAHVGVMVERTKQKLYIHGFMWSHDFPTVT